MNHTVINKKQGDQIGFFPEKMLEKMKWIHYSSLVNSSYRLMDCVVKWGNRFINSTRNFLICLKMLSCNGEKTIELS